MQHFIQIHARVLSNLANRQTDRQTDKHGQKHLPPPFGKLTMTRFYVVLIIDKFLTHSRYVAQPRRANTGSIVWRGDWRTRSLPIHPSVQRHDRPVATARIDTEEDKR